MGKNFRCAIHFFRICINLLLRTTLLALPHPHSPLSLQELHDKPASKYNNHLLLVTAGTGIDSEMLQLLSESTVEEPHTDGALFHAGMTVAIHSNMKPPLFATD